MDTAHMPHLPPHLPNLHFLVAEADPVQRRALADALTQLGASRVTEVPDAPMALRTLQAGFSPKIDVAILDLALGGMDGMEMLRAIAALGSSVRLIVTGAQPPGVLFSVETLVQAYGVDLLGTIAKPVNATSSRRCSTTTSRRVPAVPMPPPCSCRTSASPKSASACRSVSSNHFFSPRSNWPPARSRAWRPLRAGAIPNTACWARPPLSRRWRSTTGSTSSTGP
jgi:CheY-like chemotaxis protein